MLERGMRKANFSAEKLKLSIYRYVQCMTNIPENMYNKPSHKEPPGYISFEKELSIDNADSSHLEPGITNCIAF